MPLHHPRKSDKSANDPDISVQRFWLPRGIEPDTSDGGFLRDPKLFRHSFLSTAASAQFGAELGQMAACPVLVLMGEPGMGKSTEIEREADRLRQINTSDLVLFADMASCGDTVEVKEKIFQSPEFRTWEKGSQRLHTLLDGFDTCLLHVPTLVGLLLDGFGLNSTDRLSLRIACRATEWPADLEDGLRSLWGQDAVAAVQLAPLRRDDARIIAEAKDINGEQFLKEVDRVDAAHFANRPIALKHLIEIFQEGKGLPTRKVDLFRVACLNLCDEWRNDLRRTPKARDLSSGLRFAVSSRVAALGIFCRRAAIWTGPGSHSGPPTDVGIEQIFGGDECFERETIRDIGSHATWAALNTALFRTAATGRVIFSHQTYQEFLAARYVSSRLNKEQILKLIMHADGSGKVVPQLRETAAWIAEMRPEVAEVLIASDPTTVLMSDTTPSSDRSRRELMRQILHRYETGEMIDLRIGEQMVWKHGRSKIVYPGIADDLRPYINEKARKLPARLVAMMTARIAELTELQEDLLRVALDEKELSKIRVIAAVTVSMIGDVTARKALKVLLAGSPQQVADDDLKGAALAATWPDHLTADELFNALTPPNDPTAVTAYRRFLGSDFAANIKPADMPRALDWAGPHATAKSARHQAIGIAALSVVVAAVACCEDPEVCSRLASILVQIARASTPVLELMRKMCATRATRLRIMREAIRVCEKDHLGCLVMYGVVDRENDVPFFLSELERNPPTEMQEKISSLIAGTLQGIPWSDAGVIDLVLAAAERNPILGAAMKPVLAATELDSEVAAKFRRSRDTVEEQQACYDPSVNLVSAIDDASQLRFYRICELLERGSRDPRPGEVIPDWGILDAGVQKKIALAAEEYLASFRMASVDWIGTGEICPFAQFGYWGLRVLAAAAPSVLECLDADTWHAWMPSVFGNHYAAEKPDGLHNTIIKLGYARDPARFRELLNKFIERQSDGSRELVILDRLVPIWDDEIANLLRDRVTPPARIHPRPFRVILRRLMGFGDAGAVKIAEQCLSCGAAASGEKLDRAVTAALELFASKPAEAWSEVWKLAAKNKTFAERLFAAMATEPYGTTVERIISGVTEDALADMEIWLLQNVRDEQPFDGTQSPGPVFGLPFEGRGWPALRGFIGRSLLGRGTADSTEAIRRIKAKFPNEVWGRMEKDSEEVVRDISWSPLTPSEFLDLALTSIRSDAETKSGGGELLASVLEDPSRTDARPPATEPLTMRRRFAKSGDIWRLEFEGDCIAIKHSKGMAYIHLLLQSPDHAIDSLELSAAIAGPPPRRQLSAEDLRRLGMGSDAGQSVTNSETRARYKAAIDDLDRELGEAKNHNDIGRMERLTADREAVIQQLRRDAGLAGRSRKFSTDSERSRKAVTNAISSALKNIGRHHSILREHLNSRISRGGSLTYRSDGVDWDL